MSKKLGHGNSEANPYVSNRSRVGIGKRYGPNFIDSAARKGQFSNEQWNSFPKESALADPVAPPALSHGPFRLAAALPFDDEYGTCDYYEDSGCNKENHYETFREDNRVEDELVRTFYHMGHLLWLHQMKPPPPPPPPKIVCDSTISQTDLVGSDIDVISHRLGLCTNRIDHMVKEAALVTVEAGRLRSIVSEITSDRDMQAEENQQTISRLTLEVISLKEELMEEICKSNCLEKTLSFHISE